MHSHALRTVNLTMFQQVLCSGKGNIPAVRPVMHFLQMVTYMENYLDDTWKEIPAQALTNEF
jgi:hypothetical protein